MSSPPPPAYAYTLGIHAYGWAIRCAALWRRDARLWVQGRRNAAYQYQHAFRTLAPPGERPRVWLHCASLGEYEQGLPMLRAVLKDLEVASGKRPQGIISFFSPSGLQAVADRHEDLPCVYLPLDTPAAAADFARSLNADIGLVVKYEFWLNHLAAVESIGTRLHLVAARFRADHVFFGAPWKPWTQWFRNGLRRFAGLHCQDAASKALLDAVLQDSGASRAVPEPVETDAARPSRDAAQRHASPLVEVSGDTRFDRVLERASEALGHPLLEGFARQGPVLVAGSTWLPDDRLLAQLAAELLLPSGWHLIVAPHHVDARHVQQVLDVYNTTASERDAQASGWAAPLSAWSAGQGLANSGSETRVDKQVRILVVDQIGLLASAYRLGKLAYIGGGFGAGIHNTLEAAVYGMPMAFGPRWQKFAEAGDLIACQAARSIADYPALKDWATGMIAQDDDALHGKSSPAWSAAARSAAEAAKRYVQEQSGAVDRIRSGVMADWQAHRKLLPSAKATSQ